MFDNINSDFKKWLVIVVAGFAVSWGLVWVSTRGFIVVNTDNVNKTLDVSLVNSEDGNVSNLIMTSGSRKLIKRGEYEIKVSAKSGSYFSTVEVPGFLRGVATEAKLTKARARTFVGDNPLACMNYEVVLVSYSCGSPVDSLQIHQEATAEFPSVIDKPNLTAFSGFDINSYIQLGDKDYMLLSFIGDEGSTLTLHSVSKDGTPKLKSTRNLTRYINQGEEYTAVSYKEGFLLFTKNSNQILRFDSINDVSPSVIDAGIQGDGAILSITTNDETIVVSSSERAFTVPFKASFQPSFFPEAEVEGNYNSAVDQGSTKSHVSLITNGSSRDLSFDFEVSQVELCGNNSLCVLSIGGGLHVYDLTREKLVKVNELKGVIQIATVGDQTLVVQEGSVVKFDAEANKGYVQYSFDQYKYCGIQPINATQYLLCIDKSEGSRPKSVLMINTEEQLDGAEIDKQILKLYQLPEVKSVAPYGKFIYISPELGKLQPGPDGGLFYNPETISLVNKVINSKVEQLDIDLDHYQIINPYSND